jgi:hypothetical protein
MTTSSHPHVLVATLPQAGITKCGAIAAVKVSGVIAANINGT